MFETGPKTEERIFAELRRTVRNGEVFTSHTRKLLRNLRFTGRICIVLQNGIMIKSGYEEGYFSRRLDDRLVP